MRAAVGVADDQAVALEAHEGAFEPLALQRDLLLLEQRRDHAPPCPSIGVLESRLDATSRSDDQAEAAALDRALRAVAGYEVGRPSRRVPSSPG